MAPDQLAWLGQLHVTRPLVLDGQHFFLVHATPRDPLDEYLGPDPAVWARRLNGLNPRFLCVGHTHLPFVLSVNGTTVLNPGSGGQPRDGDPRPSYAIIQDGRVELRRGDYNVEETVALLQRSPLPQDAKDLAVDVLRTGGRNLRSPLEADPSPMP